MKLKLAVATCALLTTPAFAGGYGYEYGGGGVFMEKRLYVEPSNGYYRAPSPPRYYGPPRRPCCGPPRRRAVPYFYQAPQNQINIGGDNFGGASIINQN